MKVSVKESGGFAGIEEEYSIDTSQLDSPASEQIIKIVNGIGFFDIPAAESGAVGSDMISYEITVKDGGKEHKIVFVDDQSAETASLRELVDSVKQTAGL